MRNKAVPQAILSPWTLAARVALVARMTRPWGLFGSEGRGGPLSVSAGAWGWVGADLGGTATVTRRPKPQSAVERGMPAAAA